MTKWVSLPQDCLFCYNFGLSTKAFIPDLYEHWSWADFPPATDSLSQIQLYKSLQPWSDQPFAPVHGWLEFACHVSVQMDTSGNWSQTGPNGWKPRTKKYLLWGGTLLGAWAQIAPSTVRMISGAMRVHFQPCYSGWLCPVVHNSGTEHQDARSGGSQSGPFWSALGWQLPLPSDHNPWCFAWEPVGRPQCATPQYMVLLVSSYIFLQL